MDLVSLLFGAAFGILLGGVGVFWFMKPARQPIKSTEQTESELKAVLASKAQAYLDSSKQVIEDIEISAQKLKTQLDNYQTSLSHSDFKEDTSKSTFYGEHASVYLRNSAKNENKPVLVANNDAQPRDFSSDASGLFAGSESEEINSNK